MIAHICSIYCRLKPVKAGEWTGTFTHVRYPFLTLLRVERWMDIDCTMSFAWIDNVNMLSDNEQHYKTIVAQPRPIAQYNVVNFLAYIMYAPLYIAGPILPFNAFVEQVNIRLLTTAHHAFIVTADGKTSNCQVSDGSSDVWSTLGSRLCIDGNTNTLLPLLCGYQLR
jgi:hypothetical protein